MGREWLKSLALFALAFGSLMRGALAFGSLLHGALAFGSLLLRVRRDSLAPFVLRTLSARASKFP